MISGTTRQAQALELLDAFANEVKRLPLPWKATPGGLPTGRAILKAEPETQVAVIRAAWALPLASYRKYSIIMTNAFSLLVSQLCKRSLPYEIEDVHTILQAMRTAGLYRFPLQAMLRALAQPLADAETLAACRSDLELLRLSASSWYASADQRKFLKLLDEILSGQQGDIPFTIPADEWGDQVRPLLDQFAPAIREPWLALLRHCATASGSAPSGKWLATVRQLRENPGSATFTRLAAEWIGAFRKSSNKPPESDPHTGRLSQGCLLIEENADLLRGLAWCCADVEDAALAATLADAAIAGYRKITGVGPRSAKVAGASVYALKNMPGLHGAAQLERVRLNVKQPTYQKGIQKALDEAARRVGMSREDLEELTVPTFGLEQGRLRMAIGPAAVELEVSGSDVRIQWHDAAGKPRKAEPAELKRDHKAALKDLKRLRDDMARMLAAQRDRLERLPLAERQWSLSAWRARYLDHPLIGGLARRLIWRFTDGERVVDGIWLDGRLVDVNDQPLDLSEAANVSVWHPILCAADEVLAWRNWLERHQIAQPFKQAHREVYLLTDAERATRVYSNRFAAHILRQHQFNALAAARGWRNQLRLMVDDAYPPATLELSRWGLRVEFWIEGAGDNYGEDTNETGTYLIRGHRPGALLPCRGHPELSACRRRGL